MKPTAAKRRSPVAAAPLMLAVFGCVIPRLPAQCGLDWLAEGVPGVAGKVDVITNWDPDGSGPRGEVLLVGGFFHAAGDIETDNLVAWDPSLDRFRAVGPGFPGRVEHLATDANGQLLVNGYWLWNGLGWTQVGSPGTVEATAFWNGDPVVISRTGFGPWNWVSRVSRWNGSRWIQFGAHATGPATYRDLATLADGSLVAGRFAGGVVRWSGNSWQPLGGGLAGGCDRMVVLPNGDLIVAGSFPSLGSLMARWDGSQWRAMGGGPSAPVVAMTSVDDGLVAATRDFVGGPINALERWDGARWSKVGPPLTSSDHVVALGSIAGGKLIVGGQFTGFVGAAATGLARWNGVAWKGLWGGVCGRVTDALVTSQGVTVVAGDFTMAPQIRGIARWDGTAWTRLGQGLQSDALYADYRLAELPGGDLVVGGTVTRAGGVPVSHVARWDGSTWSPMGTLPQPVFTFAQLPGGDLVAGIGRYPGFGSVWRWDGTSWSQIGSNMNDPVQALCVRRNGELLAAGNFTQVGGQSRDRLVAWDGSAWNEVGGGRPSNLLDLVELPSGEIVVGSLYGGAGYLAQWDGASWSVVGGDLDGRVESMDVMPNGDLVVSGWFTGPRAGGPVLNGLGRWDGVTWSTFPPGPRDRAGFVVVDPAGGLVLGRAFVAAGAAVSHQLARVRTDCPAVVEPIATACIGPAGAISLVADDRPWTGTRFGSTASGFAGNALAVSLVGLGSPGRPLTWLWPNTLPGCEQLASQEAITLAVPQGGVAHYGLDIPDDAVFAGVELFHQWLQFDLDAQGALDTLSSSNGLRLVIGRF